MAFKKLLWVTQCRDPCVSSIGDGRVFQVEHSISDRGSGQCFLLASTGFVRRRTRVKLILMKDGNAE